MDFFIIINHIYYSQCMLFYYQFLGHGLQTSKNVRKIGRVVSLTATRDVQTGLSRHVGSSVQ